MQDSLLGYRIKPNCTKERHTKIFGNDTVYDVYYSSDEYGRRWSIESDAHDTTPKNDLIKKHAVFLGCSITFGDGLNDSSTFPAIFEFFHPAFKSYNYGVTGYAPNQICLLFDEGINTLNNYAVPEDSGFCIYTYIDDHLNRVYGNSEYLNRGEKTPDVCVNNNKLIVKKRPRILIHISRFLNNSETMKYFRLTTSYPESEEFYKRFADLINYMAVKYRKIKPHGKFYVGLYPGNAHDTSWVKFLDRKIKVLNIPPPIDFETNLSSYIIKGDAHPTKKLNSYYSREISKFIHLN